MAKLKNKIDPIRYADQEEDFKVDERVDEEDDDLMYTGKSSLPEKILSDKEEDNTNEKTQEQLHIENLKQMTDESNAVLDRVAKYQE